MPVDDDLIYVGLSARTNQAGIDQFAKIAARFGKTVKAVPVEQVLHLKTGTTYMGDNKLLVAGEYIDSPYFKDFDQLKVPVGEDYAVNCINTGNGVIMPAGFLASINCWLKTALRFTRPTCQNLLRSMGPDLPVTAV